MSVAVEVVSQGVAERVCRPQGLGARRLGGRPPKLGAAELQTLKRLVLAQPQASLAQLVTQLTAYTGRACSPATVRRALHGLGIRRGPPKPAGPRQPGAVGARRYGYSKAHRDPGSPTRYPSSLTDAEWALIEDLFVHRGPGQKPTYSRRLLLDALLYLVRSGCPWRLLPHDLPPWQNVYATFRRWTRQGIWERMHQRLREQYRLQVGKDAQPSVAVLDSQSVPTTEKGGPAALTRPKRSRGASAT
jgi:transposase